MNFDDHEIWGAPVRTPEATAESEGTPAAAPVEAAVGRLYRSAGSDPHPDAILALPGQRRHTAAHPIDAANVPPAAVPEEPRAAISINSRIPRPAPIEDAAIAEVLGGPAAGNPVTGFTSWFKRPASDAPEAAEAPAAAPVDPATSSPGIAALPARVPNGLLGQPLRAGAFAFLVFAVSTLVALVEAAVRNSLGVPTGVALLLAVGGGAWRLQPEARWSAWVLPPYLLIATILVAGQFTNGAPGFSPIGQAMLVVAWLISLAPWLALAVVTGIVVPVLMRRG